MPLMNISAQDPSCAVCIGSTTVELISGTPCTIKVHVYLHSTFPGAGEYVTSAALQYADDDGNSTSQSLGPPTGPAYTSWTAGSDFTITFSAATWLTGGDFEGTTATMTVKTNRKQVAQSWSGVV